MTTRARNGKEQSKRIEDRVFRMAPIARAIAMTLAASGVINAAHAQQAFSPSWFAAKGAVQNTAAQTGKLPNGMPASSLTSPLGQQQRANDQLKRSVNNLTLAARGIAAQQAAQEAARRAAGLASSDVPDGLAEGGLKVDTNSLTAGWLNAKDPTQTVAGGRTTVDIQQTADKAILNWETFNVGKNTTVDFKQNADWAVLNRVNDPNARPSQILGQIKGDGTVLVVNRNGVVFDGTSQVNTRNLVAAAANITNTQFQNNGIYGADANTPSFTDALGKVEVKAGARITTHEPKSVTQGGGYVLLAGSEVHNAGEITTRKGQTQLAAGDSFLIRKGVGTDANTASTTRGNEISPQFVADSTAGKVTSSGLILSREGDITLAGRDVRQDGVAISTTTVNIRGTVHLLNSAADTLGKVTLGKDAITAVVLEDDGKTTALDSQRDALIKASATQDLLRSTSNTGAFDNLSILSDRRDQSRIEIVSGGNVVFEGDSLTLATGGQIVSDARGRSFVTDKAQLDVAGAVGVTVAMESNNVKVNVQGNELRDSPQNRDSGKLFNNDVWMDRRQLMLVPKGTGGYESDRWYTSNGLLEVGGYLSNQGHGIGEWAAQGGTVLLGGQEVVTQAGSSVNLAGGTLDVQTGFINQTWLKGGDGRLYSLDKAPADMVFNGVYKGFESDHERWKVTEFFYNPLIGPQKRLENGYTVGRDAGTLIVSAPTAILEGDIVADVFNGALQSRGRDATADGYRQAQTAVARAGTLALGHYGALGRIDAHGSDVRIGDFATLTQAWSAAEAMPEQRLNAVWLNAAHLSAQELGGLTLATRGTIAIESDLVLANGGALELVAPVVNIQSDITARGGSVTAGNRLEIREITDGSTVTTGLLKDGTASVTLRNGATIDTRGLWVNALLDPSNLSGLAFVDGGDVTLRSHHVTVEAGSRIDASSGGALLPSRTLMGGKGGDIALLASGTVGDSDGRLVLDGQLVSHGVTRGGRLTIQGDGEIRIVDELGLIDSRIVIGVGEETLREWRLQDETAVEAGERLPFAYSYTVEQRLEAGSVLTDHWQHEGSITVGTTGWTIPADADVYDYRGYWETGVRLSGFVPAGTQLYYVGLNAGTTLPVALFPNGVLLGTTTHNLQAGDHAPHLVTFNAGTTVPVGTKFYAPTTLVYAAPTLSADFFQQGFSGYTINGLGGVTVAPDVKIEATMPVYRLNADAYGVPTGSDPSAALSLWLPDVYTVDPVKGTLTQRAGVDLELLSGQSALQPGVASGGSVTLGKGTSITVDPGHKVTLATGGQTIVDGSITAHGGEIAILNNASSNFGAAAAAAGLSIWIGEHAQLDVSARAVTARDVRGRLYGVVPDGGRIVIGSVGGDDPIIDNAYLSSPAFIVIREGAVLDASGAGADLSFFDASANTTGTRTVASNGGSITLDSYKGIHNDGRLLARAGGAGASGGTLTLNLEAPTVRISDTDLAKSGRVLHVTRDGQPSNLLPGDLVPGANLDGLIGHASLSAAKVADGGFDNLSLFARTAIAFDGDVDLVAGRSIVLRTAGLHNSVDNGRATVSAPYVHLDGHFVNRPVNFGEVVPNILPLWATTGTLSLNASLIDVGNRINTHVGKLTLGSTGDLRFLAPWHTSVVEGDSNDRRTVLAGLGDVDLIAQRIYPTTHAMALVIAGNLIDKDGAKVQSGNTGTLTIDRYNDGPVAVPQSVFGQIKLEAATIRQGGNLFAPLGELSFDALKASDTWGTVEFLPGSLTSVSARGLLIPYGGTVDGVNYTIDGKSAPFYDLLSGVSTVSGDSRGRIDVTAELTVSHEGSVLDLSGGGDLTGAAFVSGRGGSVDALINPLIAANPSNGYSASVNTVYAIVPGVDVPVAADSYATAWNGAVPSIGERITISKGVQGLPAGTYMLLPASYALLPGGYRVELGARTTNYSSALALPDGSYITSATRSVAGTAISDALFTAALITPGSTVRSYSQYNETSYASFQSARAATFGTVRPLLPEDGKFLAFNLRPLALDSAPRVESAVQFNGSALFAPGENGYGGTVSVSASDLVITGPGSTTERDRNTFTVGGSDLAKIGAPSLNLGATTGTSLTLESGVTLTGSQVALLSRNITLKSGASINTLGRGVLAPDLTATGLPSEAAWGIVVSNGKVVVKSDYGEFGSIKLEDGSSLYSEGSIVLGAGDTFDIQGGAHFGTRDFYIVAPSFNIGTEASLAAAKDAGILSTGLSLDQPLLDRLIAGGAVSGAPGIENLFLAASNSVNFYNSVNLSTFDAEGKSRLQSLVLDTPAIYGHGSAADRSTLSTDRFVWSSRALYAGSEGAGWPIYKPAVPGAIIVGGPGTGAGSFNIEAREVVFGYPERSQPNTTLQLDRLMLGFGEVSLNASERITSNNVNSLSVWRTGSSPGVDFNPATYVGEAGRLNLVTPLVTGESGSRLAVYAGGDLRLTASAGAVIDTAAVTTMGATLDLRSSQGTIFIDTAVALPSGKFTAVAHDDLRLDERARIDLSGRAIPFKDIVKYSWGGDVELESTHGDIVQAANSVIDVSATHNHAGSIGFVAVADGEGSVMLEGTLRGDAGEGFVGGSIGLRAQKIGDDLSASFAVLNSALNAGGFFATREFHFNQGDLVIGNGVKAQTFSTAIDGGSLTVTGYIDASGYAPGTIRLAARDNLSIESGAVLDVRGTVLQTDSYGQPIEAKNRGTIELTSSKGWLRLSPNATLDLTSPDTVARGKVELNVGRTAETSGDARIDVSGAVAIRGVQSIALNAFWSYSPTDVNGSIVQNNGSTSPVSLGGSVGLDQIDARNVLFIDTALADSALQARLVGLAAYGDAFHVRPGVEITSKDTPSGNLTVGNLDLAKYRYGPNANRDINSTDYGAGEPLALAIRATRDLTIKGSISDGFKVAFHAPATYGVSTGLALVDNSNFFSQGATRRLVSGQTVSVQASDERGWQVPFLVTGAAFPGAAQPSDTDGNTYASGTWIPNGTVLNNLVLQAAHPNFGGLVAGLQTQVEVSPATPTVSSILAPGTLSASIRLVSGTVISSSDTRAVQTLSALGSSGSLLLSDGHTAGDLPASSVIRTGTGNLELVAGRDLAMSSPFGIYTAGTQIDAGENYSGVTSQGGHFTQGGGDVQIAAGRNLTGYVWHEELLNGNGANNYAVANWLVRQGDASTPAAWGVRFSGFSGIGTLGGGNLAVDVGSDAGALGTFEQLSDVIYKHTGLVFAVASSGRVTADGNLHQTGGGDLSVDVGGRLNPLTVWNSVLRDDHFGSFTGLRGDLRVRAGAIGSVPLQYGMAAADDPRPFDYYTATRTLMNEGGLGGPVVVIGDGAASLQTRGDLVLGGVGDAGRLQSIIGDSGVSFSLWRPETAIRLLSAGGNIVPYNDKTSEGNNEQKEGDSAGSRALVTPIFEAVAANGSIYGSGAIELAPSPQGYLELLAKESIHGGAWSVSGASANASSNPFRPGTGSNYFQFQLDTVTANLHEDDEKLIRIYAMEGDIVNFTLGGTGQILGSPSQSFLPLYRAAMPARIHAGRDIVNLGKGAPTLILNNDPTDVSIIQAGGDIFYANVQIAGPGTLELTAGGNFYQGDKASITSIGPIVESDTRLGASIAVQVGAGAAGPKWDDLTSLYLDPANRADTRPGYPLADQPGKVARTYEEDLKGWLKERYGYEAGSASDALTYFNGLAPEQQRIFLRSVYYAELKAGGREYNDVNGPRLGSYLRGRQAIAALFPEKDADGNSIERGGSLTQFGASGIQTLFGGDIQILAPAGQIVVGVTGEVPPASSGLITQGDGNIQLYSEGSVLLGLSRIMTTFGGDILAWSAKGDINAGRGSKTTLVYTPPKRVYDAYGNVKLSPDVPSTGAGIATLNPLPEVSPGDVDLIAPLGTIDLGEAGIRVSGDVNFAALQVVNAANLQVQGEATGIPTVAAVNVAALTNASAAASQAAGAAQEVLQRDRASARQNLPSVFTVRVLGFGNEGFEPNDSDKPPPPQSGLQSGVLRYDTSNLVQLVGNGQHFDQNQLSRLTAEERRLVQQSR